MRPRGAVPAISVDLASGHYADVGVVVLGRTASDIQITPIDLPEAGLVGRPNAEVLARFLVELATELGATAIGLDGPQGWKSANNGREHSRVCEALLHTQGKTGVPGNSKPGSYLGFISFCIDTFDALDGLGWPRLSERSGPAVATSLETFPTAAWRSVSLPPLPGKSKARDPEVRSWTEKLTGLGDIHLAAPLTHDQLQAAISGLGVLAFAHGNTAEYEAVGGAPFRDGPHWLEGFIVNPRRIVNYA